MHDSVMTRKRRWVLKEKRPVVTVTGSHSKTIVFGMLSLDGKQLFRQYERFDSHPFMAYLEEARKKFRKFIMIVDRATQHRSRMVKEYLQRNLETTRADTFQLVHPSLTLWKNAGDRASTTSCQTITLVSRILRGRYPNITEQEGLTLT